MRKYITPGSVRIYGVPGIEGEACLRDNGCGQICSESEKLDSINYWTGEVLLDQKLLPKIGFWDALFMSLLKQKSPEVPEITCEYEVSLLDIRTSKPAPRPYVLGYPFVTGR